MFEPFLGQIMLVPYNFAPRGWAFCHSQLLPSAPKTTLFSPVGTRFGGDGQTTFTASHWRESSPGESRA